MKDVKVYRIGARVAGKVRPVKIIMASEDHVKRVIKKAKEIKGNSRYGGLAFSTDRTKQQLHHYKQLKEELQRRIEEGEGDLGIKYVRGEQQIVKLKN